MTDKEKIKEELEELLFLFEDCCNISHYNHGISILKRLIQEQEKALKPEPEFYPGQGVLIDCRTIRGYESIVKAVYLYESTEHPGQCCILHKKQVRNVYLDHVKPDPDFVPPGFIKIHTHDGSSRCPCESNDSIIFSYDENDGPYEAASEDIDWKHVHKYAIWQED